MPVRGFWQVLVEGEAADAEQPGDAGDAVAGHGEQVAGLAGLPGAFTVLDRGALLVTTRDAGLVELSDEQARTPAAGWAAVLGQVLAAPAAETLRLAGNLALGVATLAALPGVTSSGGPS